MLVVRFIDTEIFVETIYYIFGSNLPSRTLGTSTWQPADPSSPLPTFSLVVAFALSQDVSLR